MAEYSKQDFMNPPPLIYRQAASIVLVNPRGEILMGERQQLPNIWKMPGGGIETGEFPRHAALRELEEETGITRVILIAESAKLHTIHYPVDHKRYLRGYKGQTTHWFLGETFQMSAEMIEKAVRCPPKLAEFKRLRWVRPQDVPMLAHNDKTGDAVSFQNPKIYQAILMEFALLQAAPALSAETGHKIHRTPPKKLIP